GWTLPETESIWWTGFVFASIAIPPLIPILAAFLPSGIKQLIRSGFGALGRETVLACLGIVFTVAFLARHAWLALDAIARTLFRVFISRKFMLQWVTFAEAAYNRRSSKVALAFQLGGAASFAAAVVFLIVREDRANLIVAAPFVALWAVSPIL